MYTKKDMKGLVDEAKLDNPVGLGGYKGIYWFIIIDNGFNVYVRYKKNDNIIIDSELFHSEEVAKSWLLNKLEFNMSDRDLQKAIEDARASYDYHIDRQHDNATALIFTIDITRGTGYEWRINYDLKSYVPSKIFETIKECKEDLIKYFGL